MGNRIDRERRERRERREQVGGGTGKSHPALCLGGPPAEAQAVPETRTEVQQIEARWEQASAESVAVYYGPQASKDNFKKAAPGARVVHLATHGYFLEGACQPQSRRLGRGGDQGFVGENPFLLSGLLFAGSNLHGEGADNAQVDDGILTASEVSGLDLAGTELVVLSACETGLGEAKAGEGVYRSRRAFQMAGARTVISSLWPAPDQATAEVMSQLYGQSKATLPERLRNLQLAQIKNLRASGSSDHPYSWAAFIALGDWRYAVSALDGVSPYALSPSTDCGTASTGAGAGGAGR